MAVTSFLFVAGSTWSLPMRNAHAQEISIDVTIDQRASVTGRSASRRTVIEDVCYRAGVELVFYDAIDRSFGGSYQDLPLRTLFERVLAEESFMVEATNVPGLERETITTLRVLGDPAVATARRARGGGPRGGKFQIPPTLLAAAFGTPVHDAADPPSSAERDTALATMAGRISGDPAQLQGFLGTDSRLIAQAIQRYPGVERPLRELQRRYPDPRISTKIDEIIAALQSLPADSAHRTAP